MAWTILGCFGSGKSGPSIDDATETEVVLSDAGLLFGTNSSSGSADGWKLDAEGIRRFAPETPGTIVAASATPTGAVVVVAQVNGTQPQLWWGTDSGWDRGQPITHGRISQILRSSDGALWTEGASGVHRSTDSGLTWSKMAVPNDLQLGTIKLGEHNGRIAFSGRELVVTADDGATWTTVLTEKTNTTDGEWVARQSNDSALRIGKISNNTVEWVAEVDGHWHPAAIHGNADGVQIFANKALSTQGYLIRMNTDGTSVSTKRIETRAEWIGLGNRTLWVNSQRTIQTQP